jgi:hypothetical protein
MKRFIVVDYEPDWWRTTTPERTTRLADLVRQHGGTRIVVYDQGVRFRFDVGPLEPLSLYDQRLNEFRRGVEALGEFN